MMKTTKHILLFFLSIFLVTTIISCSKKNDISDENDKQSENQEPASLVGAYYYPWYVNNNFHGNEYLRKHLDPIQTPELGKYSEKNPAVIKQHLEWCEYSGINLWVCSWWGPGDETDQTLKNHILNHPDLSNMKIALIYETVGRIPGLEDISNVEPDINYIIENYFDHPNYLKINEKPVLFLYLSRVLSQTGILEKTIKAMRETAKQAGLDLYIVGDQVFGQPPSSTDQIVLLDAITNYDVYGNLNAEMYATQEKVNKYFATLSGWRSMAHQEGVSFIPAISPGFNDRGVRSGHVPLSRKLSDKGSFGSLFEEMLDGALKITDPELKNLLMITSWNEWHEDTQIEPAALSSASSKDDSESTIDYTSGLEYEGYGTKYLDILKKTINK